MTDRNTPASADERPSRSARKRDAEALQDLGARLAMLPETVRHSLPLTADLKKALDDYRAATTNGAKRRQLQYIGRLMRETDSTLVEAALAEVEQRSASTRFRHHELERWRTQLIAEDSTLTAYLDDFPRTDARRLRALIRDARTTQGSQTQTRAFRELFRLLRDNTAAQDATSDDDDDN